METLTLRTFLSWIQMDILKQFKVSEHLKLQELENFCHFKNRHTQVRTRLLGTDPTHSNASPPFVYCCSTYPRMDQLLQVMWAHNGQELTRYQNKVWWFFTHDVSVDNANSSTSSISQNSKSITNVKAGPPRHPFRLANTSFLFPRSFYALYAFPVGQHDSKETAYLRTTQPSRKARNQQ